MSQSRRQAIIDIGSNSIRLVVFGGPPRAPALLFNEKLMAGLGRGVVAGGQLDPENVAAALNGLARFAALLKLIRPDRVRVVATAAVREASDGDRFLAKVRKLGLKPELLSGDEEAVASGYGVISAMPQARGLVADMGGGSLELVRVGDGEVHERISLPLGAMRVASIRAGGTGRLRKTLRAALEPLDWVRDCAGLPLYLVGGSWRTLARVHMHLHDWPLPVLGNYAISSEDARELKTQVRAMGTARLLTIPGVGNSRVLQLDDAAALLAALASEIAHSQAVVSAFGLREGLLYQDLPARERTRDPLIEGVEHIVGGQTQVPGYAQALLQWSDGAFPEEAQDERRLRHAACLIAGTGWASNPDFRVIEGEDMALHGNWIGVDAADRAVMAMALHVGLGGDPDAPPEMLLRLASGERLARARAWGLAVRLAQRLGGGSPQALQRLPLRREGADALVLTIPPGLAALADPRVERRLARLALALGLTGTIES